jgi:hybrid cluster-associated redox disulfide protein
MTIMRPPRKTPGADSTVQAVLDARPDAARVLLRHGMACVGCTMAPFETMAEAAREYGVDLPSLLRELRRLPDSGGSPKPRSARRPRREMRPPAAARPEKPVGN